MLANCNFPFHPDKISLSFSFFSLWSLSFSLSHSTPLTLISLSHPHSLHFPSLLSPPHPSLPLSLSHSLILLLPSVCPSFLPSLLSPECSVDLLGPCVLPD